mmetsp:Transcript_12367/g.21132  ORF Transcript_12367/g.21132 Transcript_12367/m.21132 type:complete len:315 (-) Transcript_12367:145-1089(-)
MHTQILHTIFLHHRLFKQLANLLGLAFEHGSLIGNSYGLQILVRVESLAHRVLKLGHKLRLITTVHDVIAHILCFGKIEHNQILFSKAGRRNGLFVFPLAVDHRCAVGLLVLVQRIPHFGHPRAGSIHNLHATARQVLHFLQRRTKGGQDDHVTVFHHGQILGQTFLWHKLDSHVRKPLVHNWIVNHFIGQPQRLCGELLPGLIRNGDRSLHTPAEAVRLGQFHRDIATHDGICLLAQLGNETGGKLLRHHAFDFFLGGLEAAAVESVRCHDISAGLALIDYGWSVRHASVRCVHLEHRIFACNSVLRLSVRAG